MICLDLLLPTFLEGSFRLGFCKKIFYYLTALFVNTSFCIRPSEGSFRENNPFFFHEKPIGGDPANLIKSLIQEKPEINLNFFAVYENKNELVTLIYWRFVQAYDYPNLGDKVNLFPSGGEEVAFVLNKKYSTALQFSEGRSSPPLFFPQIVSFLERDPTLPQFVFNYSPDGTICLGFDYRNVVDLAFKSEASNFSVKFIENLFKGNLVFKGTTFPGSGEVQ